MFSRLTINPKLNCDNLLSLQLSWKFHTPFNDSHYLTYAHSHNVMCVCEHFLHLSNIFDMRNSVHYSHYLPYLRWKNMRPPPVLVFVGVTRNRLIYSPVFKLNSHYPYSVKTLWAKNIRSFPDAHQNIPTTPTREDEPHKLTTVCLLNVKDLSENI